MKRFAILAVLMFTVYLSAQEQANPGSKPLSIGQVHSIYVAPMGDGLENLIVQRLLKWPDIRVFSTPAGADAILNGRAESQRTRENSVINNRAKIHSATVSLVDVKTNAVIWAVEKGKGNGLVTFVTGGELGILSGVAISQSRLADQIVGQLRHDWQKARKAP